MSFRPECDHYTSLLFDLFCLYLTMSPVNISMFIVQQYIARSC